ncbi:hypothetical protein [Enterovirga sp. CN4-39]|uniref:hypothetical protein n=1 Tax=Enterovirga sp. CN4-39 TaxID=3400910 RepID=UPI003C038C4A
MAVATAYDRGGYDYGFRSRPVLPQYDKARDLNVYLMTEKGEAITTERGVRLRRA